MEEAKVGFLASIDQEVEDYEVTPVPPHKKRNFFDVTMVWAGFNICVATLVAGGILATGFSLSQIFWIVVVGLSIEAAYGVIIGLIGMRTGMATAALSRHALGKYGAIFYSMILGLIAQVFWYGAQAGFFGETIVELLKAFAPSLSNGPHLGNWMFWAGIGALLMMITAVIGFKGLSYLSNLAIPLITFMFALVILRSHQAIPGGLGAIWNSIPSEPMKYGTALAMVIGNFAIGACNSPDISRYSRNFKEHTIATVLGILFTQGLMFITGAILIHSYGTSNIAAAFIAIGAGIPSILFLVVAQWTTNDNNLYAGSLGVTNMWALLAGHKGWKKWRVTVILGLVGTIIAILGFYKNLAAFLTIIGYCIPPVAGVIMADYFIVKGQNYPKESFDQDSRFRDVSWPGVIAWVVGALVGAYVQGWTGIPPLNAIITGFVLHSVLGLLEKKYLKPTYWTKPSASEEVVV